MRRGFSILALCLMIGISVPLQPANGLTLAQRLSGWFLLQVQSKGELWYVYPKDLRRYYIGGGDDAYALIRRLGLGINNANLAKIPVGGSTATGDLTLRNRLSGYMLIAVEDHGKAWYVWPKTKQRYLLGSPSEIFQHMHSFGLGITNANLALIPADAGITQLTKSVTTSGGTFTVEILRFDRRNTALKIGTDTGQTTDCKRDCVVYSLGTYVSRRSGLAGVHGTYFCPADYPSCSGKTNSYDFPVYNTYSQVMINNGRIKYTTQPLVAFDAHNKPYYYHQAIDFKNQATFEATYGIGLQAEISNGPALVENKLNVLDTSLLDSKQATVKSFRGVLGWKGEIVYLMIIRGATVIDSAAVMTALGMDYAINLDGGGSAALYNAGHYIIGPGRNLPNAIVLTAR